MCRDELIQISELKACSMIRAADYTDGEGVDRRLIRTKYFRAVGLLLAVEPNQPRTHSRARCRRRAARDARSSLHNRTDNLAIPSATAQHAADCIHHFVIVGRSISFEQCRRSYQHSGCTCAALRRSMRKKGLLQPVVPRWTLRQSLYGRDFASRRLPSSH